MESALPLQESIRNQVQRQGNTVCAECFTAGPTYCSLSFGIFVCQKCATFHKKLDGHGSRIVLVLAHSWKDDEIEFLSRRGNTVNNKEYEKYLPHYYHRPGQDSPQVLREQWIRAKYEREEFKDVSQQSSYNQGSKTGALFKRAKDSNRFQRRKFILKEPEGILQYFIKYSDKSPKDNINVENLVNLYIVPEKVGNKNGMQITYEKDGIRRNLYVFGEDGKSTCDWYHAIRLSMAVHKYKNFPESEIKRFLNTSITREGWMSKTGPTRMEKFRKRWFCLIGTMLWYYEQPLDPHPLGYIPLGSKTFGYGVMKGYPHGAKADAGYGMTVHTPDRVFVLSCETLDARDKWVECIGQVLDKCTTVSSQPLVGRLGSVSAKTINVEGLSDDDDDEEVLSPSKKLFKKMTKKSASELDVNSNSEVKISSPVKAKRTKGDVFVDNTENDQNPKDAIRRSYVSDDKSPTFLEMHNRNRHEANLKSIPIEEEKLDVVAPLPAPRRRQSTTGSTSIMYDSTALTTYFLRKKTSKRVPGSERRTVKAKETSSDTETTSSFNQLSIIDKGTKPKCFQITLVNLMEESLWFLLFQSEVSHDVPDSYVTPWIGTQIAECPASVGPIKIPHEFEIAVIDKTPGDFGLFRTTGPFCVEPGDIWEVEVLVDDGSAPEMYYHEGMGTDDETIMVYANENNVKKFDVAIFKSGRKVVTRKDIAPGESANMKIEESVYLLSVDQNSYTDLTGEDIKTNDILPKTTRISFSNEKPKAKITVKKDRGKVVFYKQ